MSEGVSSLNEKSDGLSTGLEHLQIATAKTQAGMETLVSVHSSMLHSLPTWFVRVSDLDDRRIYFEHLSMVIAPCWAI